LLNRRLNILSPAPRNRFAPPAPDSAKEGMSASKIFDNGYQRIHAQQRALQPVFLSYDNIIDHCCDARNKLVDQPWTIMFIGLRDWTHRF
jgi:hypothetical protein